MSEKEKVVFKNRYGKDITFLVRKREKQPEPVPVVSIKWLEKFVKDNSYWEKDYNSEAIWVKILLKAAKEQAGVKRK